MYCNTMFWVYVLFLTRVKMQKNTIYIKKFFISLKFF